MKPHRALRKIDFEFFELLLEFVRIHWIETHKLISIRTGIWISIMDWMSKRPLSKIQIIIPGVFRLRYRKRVETFLSIYRERPTIVLVGGIVILPESLPGDNIERVMIGFRRKGSHLYLVVHFFIVYGPRLDDIVNRKVRIVDLFLFREFRCAENGDRFG